MAELKEQIVQLAESLISDPALFLVDVVVKGTAGGKLKVIVLIDGDNGITIDECAKVSRGLGAELEERESIDDAYTLEVSSPGLDHPLVSPRQYRKNKGRRVRVTLPDGDRLQGELTDVTDTDFEVAVEKTVNKKPTVTPTRWAYGEVEKTMVLVSFK